MHYSHCIDHIFNSRSSQFVYTPTRDYFFSTLDQHADTLEGDVKPPLVVLGPEGMQHADISKLY